MGNHCRRLRVVLRVSSWEKERREADHEATWLLGHTQRVSFGELWSDDKDLFVDAVLHVPCRHLKEGRGGVARCEAHGFRGQLPAPAPRRPQPRQLGGDSFALVENGRRKTFTMPLPPRQLKILSQGGNPCDGAPCRTSDHTQGAACCRDMQIEIMCTKKERKLEGLLRSRQAPYLCKVEREGDFSVNAEVISACAYIEPGGVNCTLHGRKRPDGRPAKPKLCSVWPADVEKGETLHTGCVFTPGRSTV